MSLLDCINLRRNNLKSTVTLVTCTDGKIYKETKNESVCVGNKLGFVIDTKPDNVPTKITDFLYLGSQDCCEESVISEYNFKYVLSIGVDAHFKHPHVIYNFIECLDLPESKLQGIIDQCVPFIKSAVSNYSNILVHCNAGVSRSATVVIAYMMLEEKFSLTQAFAIVKNARNCINPNVGFMKQLKSLQQ